MIVYSFLVSGFIYRSLCVTKYRVAQKILQPAQFASHRVPAYFLVIQSSLIL